MSDTQWQPVTCTASDLLNIRPTSRVSAALTNYVNGEILDPLLPPHTMTTWCDDDDVDVLKDWIDADGCRHWVPVGEADDG